MAEQYIAAVFDNVTCSASSKTITWPDLVFWIQNPTKIQFKSDAAAISPQMSGYKTKKEIQNWADKYEKIYAIGWIDLDDHNLQRADIMQRLGQIGINDYVAYSTASSGRYNDKTQRVNGRRWRIIYRLTGPLSIVNWLSLQTAVNNLMGADSSSARMQQIMYAPAELPPDTQGNFHYEQFYNVGIPLGITNYSPAINQALQQVNITPDTIRAQDVQLGQDKLFDALVRLNMVKCEDSDEPGKWFIVCPLDGSHSTHSGTADTVYYQHGCNGQPRGVKCLHGSHNGHGAVTMADLLKHVGMSHNDLIDVNDHFEDIPDAPVTDKAMPLINNPDGTATQQQNTDTLAPGYVRPAFTGFKPMDWDTLKGLDVPEPVWVVQDILPAGVSLLVGSPKVGKSWFVLTLGLMITAGASIFGKEPIPGNTFYLALEDSDSRMKKRIKGLQKAHNLSDEAIGNFTYATEGTTREDGLLHHLDDHLKVNPDTNLIIIDTLEKVRTDRPSTKSLYSYDYETTSAFKELCDRHHNLAIILVHHSNKGKKDESNVVGSVSGTNGLVAGSDNMYLIDNSVNGIQLSIAGRDVDDDDPITLTKENLAYTMESRQKANLQAEGDSRRLVMDVFRDLPEGETIGPKDLLLETGVSGKALDGQLRRLLHNNDILRRGQGKYYLSPKHKI